MSSFQSGPLTIDIVEGDITAQHVDAIVNAANNHLWMGGGVAGALKAKGGSVIETEAMGKGPIPPGEAVVTGAGRLAARHVIHAAVMGQDLRTDAELIAQSTRSALASAAVLKVSSLAFPALGTGVGGFPLDECARIMLREIHEHAAGATTLRRIVLVLYGRQAYEAFEGVAKKSLNPAARGAGHPTSR